jgi:hypothetical protein
MLERTLSRSIAGLREARCCSTSSAMVSKSVSERMLRRPFLKIFHSCPHSSSLIGGARFCPLLVQVVGCRAEQVHPAMLVFVVDLSHTVRVHPTGPCAILLAEKL